ncbi:MAG: hypothetical protein IJQ85_07570 [Selenomonadaceae bacterium]|nr:hypothetical protein [Selenomonadaceae bacterium]
MPSIKKETAGNATVYTLRNTKGNELKVTNLGARLVSMRFRDKNFTNRFMFKDDAAAGIVLVDGAKDFADIIWQAEEFIEGVKFSAELNGKSASVMYSVSNDNEISIKYEGTNIEDISTEVVFALPDADFRACQKGAAWEKISAEKIYPVTEPAEVEMELGMFGYDPGCPIDYLDAGLKNAANIFSAEAEIDIIVYATQDKIAAQAVEGGLAIKTVGNVKGQTVYMIKNRK